MRTITIVTHMLVLALVALLLGCSSNPVGEATSESATQDNLVHPAGVPRGAPSSYGNCLSVPVIFAEGYGLTGLDPASSTGLRGTAGVESFTTPYDDVTTIDGYPVYQNPSVNEWQADWATGETWSGLVPVEVDWSDNLVRQTWSIRSKVRVEVILTTILDPGIITLQGYNMYSLGGTQLQEVFVTNTTRYTAPAATVYSNVARLTIEKINTQGGNPVAVIYSSACYEGYFVDGPNAAYSAEVNMSGKCIYGFNWDIGEVPVADKSGWYRLTFSLDPNASYVDPDGNSYFYPRNTHLASLNPADLPTGADNEIVLYPPKLVATGDASSLDIYVQSRGGGRK